MADEATFDPTVVIEARGTGWVRYRNTEGRRWEVHGTCDRRGDCLVGAVINGKTITQADVDRWRSSPRFRPDSALDVPVTPEFDICCGSDLFTYVELPRAD